MKAGAAQTLRARPFQKTAGKRRGIVCKRLPAFIFVLVIMGFHQPFSWADDEPVIRTGDFYGLWHADEAKFTIDKADDNGDGKLFSLDLRWNSLEFDAPIRLSVSLSSLYPFLIRLMNARS